MAILEWFSRFIPYGCGFDLFSLTLKFAMVNKVGVEKPKKENNVVLCKPLKKLTLKYSYFKRNTTTKRFKYEAKSNVFLITYSFII